MESKIVQTPNGTIEYTSIGKGIPILFVHGGHANSQSMLPYKKLDADQYQLITPSRPGYGKTPLGENKTPQQAAQLFINLLDELGIEKAIVYSISAGGWTGLELAANYPNRVSKLILASAVSKDWLLPKDKLYKIGKIIFNPNMEWLTWGMVRLFSRLTPKLISKSFFSEFSSNSNYKLNQSDIKEFVSHLSVFHSKKGFVNDLDQKINPSILSQIKCPTLILHSQYDNSVPVAHAEHAHHKIKQSQLHLLKNNWGHLIWIGDDYEKALKLTLDFINN